MAEPVAPEFITLQQAVVGRYSLERELGRGGMGIVFLARDVALDRPVAIKLLPPELAAQPALRERFLGEARTAARLSHPNIVPIHAVEEHGELVFFVMSYIEGRTLGDRLRMQGPLTPAEGTKLVMEIAWALAYAHSCGVVHADVKPDNIILESATGRAVVMDFGIAAAMGDAGGAMGTAEYMSPEQAQGLPLDGRSDLYSLGAMAFYALAGTHPFEAVDTRALLAMHITRPAPPVAAAAPGIPRRLAQAIDKCLAKEPADRFPSGEALAEALSQSVEPRRDLPIPMRLWLSKGETFRVAYLLWYFPVGPILMSSLGPLVFHVLGNTGTTVAIVTTYVGMPLVVHGLYRFARLRMLLRQGYQLEDVTLAVRQAAERRREELAFEFAKEPPLAAKILRVVSITSLLATVGIMAFMVADSQLIPTGLRIMFVTGLVGLVGAAVGHFYPGKRITRDVGAEWRAAFWQSRFGKWLTRAARLGLTVRSPGELTYRPTEQAISLAADAIFGSLHKDLRRDLKELPAVLERLRCDAQAMRKAVDGFSAGLSALGEATPAAESKSLAADPSCAAVVEVTDEAAKLRADLTVRRDDAAQRLAATVAALENIRIGLLRLKAGAGTSAELTADLDAARALSRDMDAQFDAQREVNALVGAAPQLAARGTPQPPTPVPVRR